MHRSLRYLLLAAAFAVTVLVYWPGLSGGFLFDDYPNIVDNQGVQPTSASLGSLVSAALSSPSSEFKRPLASLTFAANYLASGLDPYWMKLTNLAIHLLNGWLVYLLSRSLLGVAAAQRMCDPRQPGDGLSNACAVTPDETARTCRVAALIAASWMLLPINLTAVLYVVQRMESMANVFVLLGLLGYVAGRRRMLAAPLAEAPAKRARAGLLLCVASLVVPAAIGMLAKETAVMLPLYAALVEWVLFGFRTPAGRADRRVLGLFVIVLVLPLLAGLAWLAPKIASPGYWSTRDFTLGTRLLSEARIVSDYVRWTVLPTPDALSFYHDDFVISTGLLSPWTTLAGMLFLTALAVLAWWLRARRPLAALGIALFLGCQLLTGTVLPLELVYEHRNYFASFGLMLAIVPLLAAPARISPQRVAATVPPTPSDTEKQHDRLPLALPRHALLLVLMLSWTALTAITAQAWGNPLRLAEELAARAPHSPRAQYELGRTYIIYSHYSPASPFTHLAYAPLERAAALPHSSILAEQALIFMNARMHLPLKDAWWDSMIAKLKAAKPGVQDESSLGALTECARDRSCNLPKQRMIDAFLAALDHPHPSARLLATYSDYAWNVLDDHALGERMAREAVKSKPSEPAYRITLVRMLAAQGRTGEARQALHALESLNIGGSLDGSIAQLHALLPRPDRP